MSEPLNIFLKANLRKTIRGLITSKRADFDSHRTKKVDAMLTWSDFKMLRICILVASARHPPLGNKGKRNLENRVLNEFTNHLEVFNSTNPIDDSHPPLSQQFRILLRCFKSKEYAVTMNQINAKHLECYCCNVWLNS